VRKKGLVVLVLALVLAFAQCAIGQEEVTVPFSAIKSSCYGEIDMSKAEFALSEVGEECVSEDWLEDNLTEEGQEGEQKQPEVLFAQANKQLENLVLDSGEKKIIKDSEVTVKRKLELSNGSELVFDSSTLILDADYKDESWGELKDGSTLVLEDTKLKSSIKFDSGIYVYEGSTLTANRVKSNLQILPQGGEVNIHDSQMNVDGTGAFLVGAAPTSDIQVVNSSLGYVSLTFWKMGNQLTLKLRPGLIEKKIIEFPPPSNTKLEIRNSEVLRWNVETGVWDANVALKDSKVDTIWLNFPEESEVEIKDLKPGHFPRLDLREKIQGTGFDWNVELLNSTLSEGDPPLIYKLIIEGDAVVNNCEGIQIRARPWTKGTTIEVRNSTITGKAILTGNGTEFRSINSKIVDLPLTLFDKPKRGQKAELYLKFEGSVLDAPIVVAANYTKIEGNLDIRTEMADVQFEPGKTLVREYPVNLRRGFDKELQLTLKNEEGKAVWGQEFETQKSIKFPIEFNRSNFTDQWRLILRDTEGNRMDSQKVNLLTSTPLELG